MAENAASYYCSVVHGTHRQPMGHQRFRFPRTARGSWHVLVILLDAVTTPSATRAIGSTNPVPVPIASTLASPLATSGHSLPAYPLPAPAHPPPAEAHRHAHAAGTEDERRRHRRTDSCDRDRDRHRHAPDPIPATTTSAHPQAALAPQPDYAVPVGTRAVCKQSGRAMVARRGSTGDVDYVPVKAMPVIASTCPRHPGQCVEAPASTSSTRTGLPRVTTPMLPPPGPIARQSRSRSRRRRRDSDRGDRSRRDHHRHERDPPLTPRTMPAEEEEME